jgi:hypothetical protein|tara:strand:- start:71 stop:403 length:333 start_codon:yes stop_codon:yes gene_type:complete
MANIIKFPYESSTTFVSLNVNGCYKVLVGSATDQIDMYYNVPSGASTATYKVTLDWDGSVISQADIDALNTLLKSLRTKPAASAEYYLVSSDTAKLLSTAPFAVTSATQP